MFDLRHYMIRRKFFKIFGASFHVYDDSGRIVGFSKQKAFKLKEDIRVYTDESLGTELLTVKARQIIDFSAAYDIVDAVQQVKVGAARRKGWTSFIRDSWEILDQNDGVLAKITEDSTLMALLRRFLSNLIPQKFMLTDNSGTVMAVLRVHFNPFLYKLSVTIAPECTIDPRVVFGSAVLLAAIEGRQKN